MSGDLESLIVKAEDYIDGLLVVSTCLVRGGQPDEYGLKALADAGVKMVVNLRHAAKSSPQGSGSFFRRRGDDEEIEQEKAIAEGLGLRFLNISLDGATTPSREDLMRFVDLFGDETNLPIFVHCLYGKERTGLMVAAYRVHVEKWTVEDAYSEMLRNGFEPMRTVLSDALFDFAGGR